MSKVIRFVGDVHGKIAQYENVIKDSEYSIQVGDMGIGFPNIIPADVDPNNHKFIRGNHDSPADCAALDSYIRDGHFDPDTSMFFLGGGYSIDHMYRTEGVSWWRDEQLSYAELSECIDTYLKEKPEIVVTHEGPSPITRAMCNQRRMSFYEDSESRTAKTLSHMMEMHQPKYWIFGHWHISFETKYNGTHYICIPELGHYDLEV